MTLQRDTADQSIAFLVYDSNGDVVTGRTHSNFTATYLRRLKGVPLAASATSISLSALGSVNATHSDGGVIEIGSGAYRLDLPDAVTVSGADSVIITITSNQSGDAVVFPSTVDIGTDANIRTINDVLITGNGVSPRFGV